MPKLLWRGQDICGLYNLSDSGFCGFCGDGAGLEAGAEDQCPPKEGLELVSVS